MLWHTAGKALSCEQVPVMEILTEFRALGGVHGRKHRPSPPPQCTWEHGA